MTSSISDVIIFSKNRPWQLGELLRTLFKYTDFSNIHVLIKSDDLYLDNYNIIRNRFENKVNFHEETRGFKQSFFEIFDQCKNYVAFMVDDVVFYNNFSCKDAIGEMDKKEIFAYQFKMNSNYIRCHTAGKKQLKPKSLELVDNHWLWTDKDGTWDWDYPFDLTGSIYRKKDISYIMDELRKIEIKNPNDIEGHGHSIVKSMGLSLFNKKFMACQKERVCACIAINHVNPRDGNSWSTSPDSDLKHINNSIFGKYYYDEKFLKNYKQVSVHIKEFKLVPCH